MFVTFEGPEGSGKSTAIMAVAETLRQHGHDVVTTREPGEGAVGQAIRSILLHGHDLSSAAEMFLFLADRAQHVERFIRPNLALQKIVLCDRYGDSTVVYQGVARGLDASVARGLNDLATGGLAPDLTLLLDIDPEIGLKRISQKDRLDSEPIEFHRKVRDAFLAEAAADRGRWAVIDASRGADLVAKECVAAIMART